MSEFANQIAAALKEFTQNHGFTIVSNGYLGKNDGTNTCVDTNFASLRKMFYYTKSGGVAQPYASAILWEGAGIVYENSNDNQDKAVKLGYIPGDTRLYILGGSGAESYNNTSGQTGIDRRLQAGAGGVTSVTASAPIASSGGATPNISLTGTIAIGNLPSSIFPTRPEMFHDTALVVTGNAMLETINTLQKFNFYLYQNTPANGDKFSHAFVVAAGTYTFFADGVTNNNCGKIDWAIDGAAAFSSGQDWYSAGTTYNVRKTVASVTLSAGKHKLTGTVNGKNGSSSDYNIILTRYGFYPSAD